ncbi:sulfite exporter TauE/SafE family protein [Aphanothece sacrum]|uniref:Probable membrane transporter protein n=1 Tax=Aphanothece sacrum FPU1 TaxID=1920663 RepID=A0A401IM07_APHSA|nr:sulfite exporter TauE/SafE family protein [Aphanothece sacrum]GBF82276.1 sulfite exporter TauE/SafE family protein [Aphanothece sacrum FPU1]GBF87187.1 sulfite exporter TauE/SafE family protein [Aphanothece sacrum FPU3]
MIDILVCIIIFIGVFTQSISGFGLGLVVMPLLTQVIDIRLASPFMTLIALTTLVSISILYRKSFQFKSIFGLIISSSLAIPLGIEFLTKVEQKITLTLLGIIVLGYALYSLLEFSYPVIKSPKWGYVFAFLSGLLSGAYNTGGPPIVIYGTCCQWTPEQFKSNLNVFFLCNVIMLSVSHLIKKNYTPEVLRLFEINVPILLLGLIVGFSVSKFINVWLFRKIVLVLLVGVGLQLLFKVWLFY